MNNNPFDSRVEIKYETQRQINMVQQESCVDMMSRYMLVYDA
ncbi:MAG: hypothetical protein ABW157_07715 [Candidatus Thiodiazotropha sp. LLP2]